MLSAGVSALVLAPLAVAKRKVGTALASRALKGDVSSVGSEQPSAPSPCSACWRTATSGGGGLIGWPP